MIIGRGASRRAQNTTVNLSGSSTSKFKLSELPSCSNGPMERAGKVFGDSQDQKLPGCVSEEDFSSVLAVHVCISGINKG